MTWLMREVRGACLYRFELTGRLKQPRFLYHNTITVVSTDAYHNKQHVNIEVEGLQQKKTTLCSSPVSQEQAPKT